MEQLSPEVAGALALVALACLIIWLIASIGDDDGEL